MLLPELKIRNDVFRNVRMKGINSLRGFKAMYFERERNGDMATVLSNDEDYHSNDWII